METPVTRCLERLEQAKDYALKNQNKFNSALGHGLVYALTHLGERAIIDNVVVRQIADIQVCYEQNPSGLAKHLRYYVRRWTEDMRECRWYPNCTSPLANVVEMCEAKGHAELLKLFEECLEILEGTKIGRTY